MSTTVDQPRTARRFTGACGAGKVAEVSRTTWLKWHAEGLVPRPIRVDMP